MHPTVSHVVGAHLSAKCPATMAKFYSDVLGALGCSSEWISILPRNAMCQSPVSIDIDSASSTPMWIPKVAVSSPDSSFDVHELAVPEAGFDTNNKKVVVAMVSSRHPSVIDANRRGLCAPFESQPAKPGVINWLDICVDNGREGSVAKVLSNSPLQWRRCKPLTFGNNDLYITALNQWGETRNRDKLCGILPHSALLPGFGMPCVVPFFCAPSRSSMAEARRRIHELQGHIIHEEIPADGFVCVARDCEGTPFALYNRTDAWDDVKPTTALDP